MGDEPQADDVVEQGGRRNLPPNWRPSRGADVLVQLRCPAPIPVQFTVGYLAQGHSATASLPGFPDLGQVPYSGCATH